MKRVALVFGGKGGAKKKGRWQTQASLPEERGDPRRDTRLHQSAGPSTTGVLRSHSQLWCHKRFLKEVMEQAGVIS